jgi:hypothetical protein
VGKIKIPLNSPEKQVKNINKLKLCQYLGCDELIETVTFETKRATGKDGKGQVPTDFYPTYSGMANTLGGIVVFGLEEIHTKGGEIRLKDIGINDLGDMMRPLTLAKEGGISDCRNRIIQSMFSHIGYSDQEGFRIVTIYKKWEQNTENSPIYNMSTNPVMITLILKINPDLLKDAVKPLEVKPDTLMSEAEPLEVKPDTLMSEVKPLEVKPVTLMSEAEPLEVKHDTLISEVEALEVKPDTLMSEPSQRDILSKKLSDGTRTKLYKMGKRSKPFEMKQIIREICSLADFTIDELCIILDRKSRSTFYSKYISELMNEKKIQRTNPEKPTSPKQKYRTILSQEEDLP